MSFLTKIAHFEEGGFRYTFKATSNRHKFRDATYVIKPCKTSALENSEILKQSRKVVQVNSLARNLTARFSDRYAAVIEDFFKVCIQQIVFTFEKLIPGTFQKYNNNDGTIANGAETSADGLKKVKGFVTKSRKALVTYCVTLKLLQKKY